MRNFRNLLVAALLIILCGCVDSKLEKSVDSAEVVEETTETAVAEASFYNDSIARALKYKEDSIALAKEVENEITRQKLSKKFRVETDDFSEYDWVYHTSSPKYTNANGIFLYFQKDKDGHATNMRFRIQYESDEWLFIDNIIFNIDGELETFYPYHMDTDCGYGGRIWEWCDESASANKSLVEKIANAEKVKVKFNGSQYYDTRSMTSSELKAFKEAYDYYLACGGGL